MSSFNCFLKLSDELFGTAPYRGVSYHQYCAVYRTINIAWCVVPSILRDVSYHQYCVVCCTINIAWCVVPSISRGVSYHQYCEMCRTINIAWCVVPSILRGVSYHQYRVVCRIEKMYIQNNITVLQNVAFNEIDKFNISKYF